MARARRDRGARKRELVERVHGFAKLLDPHLQSRAEPEKDTSEDRWPLRTTILFVGVLSIILWTLILGGLWLIFR